MLNQRSGRKALHHLERRPIFRRARSGRDRATRARVKDKLDKHRPTWPGIDQNWADVGQIWPETAQSRPTLARNRTKWPGLGQNGRDVGWFWPDFDQLWPELGRLRPTTNSGPVSPKYGRVLANFGRSGATKPFVYVRTTIEQSSGIAQNEHHLRHRSIGRRECRRKPAATL